MDYQYYLKRELTTDNEQLTTDNEQRTTDNCTGEAFGELFLAMTDNLSSKCFAPTDNGQRTTDNEQLTTNN